MYQVIFMLFITNNNKDSIFTESRLKQQEQLDVKHSNYTYTKTNVMT